jgi:hypothetical protein
MRLQEPVTKKFREAPSGCFFGKPGLSAEASCPLFPQTIKDPQSGLHPNAGRWIYFVHVQAGVCSDGPDAEHAAFLSARCGPDLLLQALQRLLILLKIGAGLVDSLLVMAETGLIDSPFRPLYRGFRLLNQLLGRMALRLRDGMVRGNDRVLRLRYRVLRL